MPRVTDSRLTKSEARFVKALFEAKGEKSIDEIAATMSQQDGRERKANSLTTMLSTVKAKFKLAKRPFTLKGVNLEPRKMAGQGRQSERTSLDDLEGLIDGESESESAAA